VFRLHNCLLGVNRMDCGLILSLGRLFYTCVSMLHTHTYCSNDAHCCCDVNNNNNNNNNNNGEGKVIPVLN
jgi:hypothetical protein